MHAGYLSALLAAGLATPLSAQWSASLVVARTATAGYLASDDGSEFRPGSPREYTLTLGTEARAWRIRAGARVIRASLTVSDGEVSLVTHGLVRGNGWVADISRRVLGDGVAPTLRAGVGGELVKWTVGGLDDSQHWVAAAIGSLEGSVAIGWRMRALVRGELAAGPSIFHDDVATDGFVLKRAIRHGVALGVSITP
ncbi:MAG: hypothetical protein H0W15_05775 [Gemmatimonadales bacterium]|nr:hypothetical protein [Gemmatimonadales bacterium]